jgi:GTPase
MNRITAPWKKPMRGFQKALPEVQMARAIYTRSQSQLLSINYKPMRKIVGTNIMAPVRTMAEFVRAKPHVNIGTIGHVDHGNGN